MRACTSARYRRSRCAVISFDSMLSVSIQAVCLYVNECVNHTGIDNDFSYGFAFGLHKKINHLSQITKPKDARDRQKSCWANKLHTEQTSEQHAQQVRQTDRHSGAAEASSRTWFLYDNNFILSRSLLFYSVSQASKQAGILSLSLPLRT